MDGYVTIGTELNTKDFDAQIDYIKGQLDDIEDKLKQADMGYEVGDVQKLEAQYEKLSNRLKDLIQKKEQFNKVDFSTINASIDNVGKGISNILKKVARWGLAVFGIRSAYMAVRNAINTIAGDDEQLKADIDYMKNAIAYTLEPVVRKIVELAKQLLFYIGYLIKSWTGYNIFENANKSLRKSVGSAKELKKQLTGFDEMNVLSNSSSGGGGGAVAPSFDLTAFENVETPQWLITIKDKLFIDLLTGNWIGVIIDFIGLLIIAFFKLKDAIVTIWENGKIVFEMFVNWIYNQVIKPIGEFFSNLWNGIVNAFKKAIQWIKDTFNSVVTFFKNIISKIVNLFKTIGTKVGDAISGAFKTVVNGVLKAIENILNFPIKSINPVNLKPSISKSIFFSTPMISMAGK